jgi:hypothetical protein
VTTDTPSVTRKTWIAIAIAALIIAGMTALALVGGGIYFASRHMSTTFVAPQVANAALDRAAARFANQTPLVHLRNESLVVDRVPDGPRQDIASLHVLAYDMRTGKLVNVTVPGWLLRRLPAGASSLTVDGVEMLEGRKGRVTMEDIERHGPGLILDGRDRDGARVLVWTE